MKNRDAYHFDDDDDEVEDGRTVRVPMMIMDGRRVNLTDTVRFEDGQPHFLRAADAASQSSTFADVESPSLGDVRTARDAARAARDRWIAEMCDAWKRPPARDAAQPDVGTRPEELMLRRHLFGAPGDPDPGEAHAVAWRREEAERARDGAWRRYRDNLQNAWKSNPRAAPRIERQAESAQWRHGA
jgi:hypothetical protein